MQKIHMGLLGLVLSVVAVALLVMPEKNIRIEPIGSYSMAIVTNPSPLKVGYDALLKVELERDSGSGVVTGCDLRFRQYMPGMDMSLDNVTTRMQEQGVNGRYTARTGKFPMGGEWVFEYTLVCDGQIHSASVSYVVPWPE